MPLGLAKDSMLNLAELASKTEGEPNAELEDFSQNNLSEVENKASFTKVMVSDDEYEEWQIDHNDSDNDFADNGKSNIIEGEASEEEEMNHGEKIPISLNISASPSVDMDTNGKPSRLDPKVQQYAGFQADYHDFENYTSYGYYQGNVSLSGTTVHDKVDKKDEAPWWQCIFPWVSSVDDKDEKDDSIEAGGLAQMHRSAKTNDVGKDYDDEISMISAESDNALGEKLSQKDRQAVLARLRLAQPDGAEGGDSVVDGLSEFRRKSILKHASKNRDYYGLSTRSNASKESDSSRNLKGNNRRSLFPAYEPKVKKKNLHTSFSPMARVLAIKSSKEMDEEEKGNIWWQKADYDEFRKTGRMISKVMLQGGSEIWLATNQSWQLPNQGKAATLRRAIEINKEEASDKWWHNFGHSRRGLEHIASIDEGRQRQANVKTSVRAVLTEQRRQKVFHREDPQKLRMCSLQYTSWAKDLALASGASDADAVSKNFDDDSRKSREFYLLKFSRAGKLNSTTIPQSGGPQTGGKQVVPAFMKPMMSIALKSNRLDANTTSRLQFEKKEVAKTSKAHKRVTSDVQPTLPGKNNRGNGSIKSIPIHDPKMKLVGGESLASKAAGFANGEEAVNMSAVLTGMGAIAKNTDSTTRARPVLA